MLRNIDVLPRSNVNIYSHQSANSFSSLQSFDLDLNLSKLLMFFLSEKLGLASNIPNRVLDIRFICDRDDIVSVYSSL